MKKLSFEKFAASKISPLSSKNIKGGEGSSTTGDSVSLPNYKGSGGTLTLSWNCDCVKSNGNIVYIGECRTFTLGESFATSCK